MLCSFFYCQSCNALPAEHLRRKQKSLSLGLTETQTGLHWTPPDVLDWTQESQNKQISPRIDAICCVLTKKGFQVGFEFSGPVGIPVLHFNARRSGSAHSSAKDDAPRVKCLIRPGSPPVFVQKCSK